MLSNDLINSLLTFSTYNSHYMYEFESILGVNKKKILNDIDKINDSLQRLNFSPIVVRDNRIFAESIPATNLFDALAPNFEDYIFYEERKPLILLYIALSREYVSNYHLQDLLRISKNSVLADLKMLKKDLKLFNVTISYSRKDGYVLHGSSYHCLLAIEWAVSKLLTLRCGKWLLHYVAYQCGMKLYVEQMSQQFYHLTQKFAVTFIVERAQEVAYLFSFLAISPITEHAITHSDQDFVLIEVANIDNIVEQLVLDNPNLQHVKQFVASRLLSCMQGNAIYQPNPSILAIRDRIIQSVKATTGLPIEDDQELKKNLYNHLVPAYYRLVFDIPLTNPLKEQIMTDYNALFYLIKRSLKPLQDAVNKPISDDEIAYFTIHFGSYLDVSYQTTSRQLRAITVCPNGISSSILMNAELQKLMPEIQFIGTYTMDQISTIPLSTYDLIFSTLYFENLKPLYLAHPIMNAMEKTLLKKQVYQDFQLHLHHELDIEQVMALIRQQATIHNETALRKELYYYLTTTAQHHQALEGIELNHLLPVEHIRLLERASDWQEAIHLAALPLLENGSIEERYITGMIESVKKSGPYIVLAPQVAVPHATPDLGVKRLGISLLQLKEAVDFDLEHEGDPDKQVKLIFVLAPIDASAHLKALQQLSLILDEESVIEQLIAATSSEEIYQLIETAIGGEEHD